MLDDLFLILGEKKAKILQGTILYVISSLFAAVPYVFLYLILKGLFEESLDFQTTIIYTFAIALCLFLQGIFLYWANYITYLTTYETIGDLRLQLGNYIRKLPMGFFTQKQVGDLNGLVTDDMTKIEPIPSWVYPKIVNAIALPTFIAIFLFSSIGV